MEEIALEKRNQSKLRKRSNKIKQKIISGKITITKNKGLKKKSKQSRGAIYIGRIPHGFYEDELRSYFKQFGTVTNVKLGRSKRTGRSKGYAFVEFLETEVAKVAAEAMNNYLMFNCILKCRYIPPEEQHRGMFVRTIHEHKYPRKTNRAKDTKNKNKSLSQDKELWRRTRTQKKIEEFKKFFEERGIEFNFKVNDPDIKDDNDNCKVNGKTNDDSESETTDESEYEDQTDDQYGVLEIDESDDEIQFKTPPQVKKVIKRYSTHRSKNNLSLPEIEKGKIKTMKKELKR